MVPHDPFAPHNGFNKSSPFKPWNRPFGTVDDLEEDERRYYEDRGVIPRRRYSEREEGGK